jgi:hypothetical protein
MPQNHAFGSMGDEKAAALYQKGRRLESCSESREGFGWVHSPGYWNGHLP